MLSNYGLAMLTRGDRVGYNGHRSKCYIAAAKWTDSVQATEVSIITLHR